MVEITQAAPEHSSVEEEAIAFRGAVPRHGIYSKVPDSDFIQRYRDDKPYSIINFWKLRFQIRKGGVRNPVGNVLVGCWSSRYNPELYLKGQHRF